MTDITQLSDADLIAQIQASQQAQQGAQATHAPTPYVPSGWLAHDPTDGMSTPELLAAGAGRGLVHGARSVANLVGAVPDSVMNDEKATDAPLLNTRSGTVGNLVGETALTAPLGMGAGKLLGTAGKLGAALAKNPISNSAVQGGVQGLVTADPGDRGVNTGVGALTGGLLGANTGLVGKLVNGLKRTPEAQTLIDQGVSLTPGQMNPGGATNQLEQVMEHVWGVGPLVANARENAEHQYQAAVIGKGAAPGTTITPSENIHGMLQQAYDSYAPLYQQAHGYPVTPEIWRTQGSNIPLTTTFDAAAKAPGVPKSLQASENTWLQDRLTQLPKNPQSEDLLQLRSDIRQRGRNANLKTDTDSGHIANIAARADKGVTASLQSQLPPEPLQALASADSNYGNYKVIENAVAKSKDNVAGLTPQKLSQSIYDATADPAYARGGGGPLRDMAQAGTTTFQTKVPPNGATVATLGALAAGGYAHPAVAIGAGTGLGAMALTPTGRSIAAGVTRPQQAVQQLRDALQARIPSYARNVGGQLGQRFATGAAMPGTQAALPQALAAALMLAPPAATATTH